MPRAVHILAEISAHGFGHLAQLAPVLAALPAELGEVQLTVRTALPRDRAAARLPAGTAFARPPYEPVPAMHDPLTVDAGTTLRRFRHYHAGYPHHVAAESSALADLGPDLVVSDIGYTVLEAARRVGVPSVALGSFSWADILAACAGERPPETDTALLTDLRTAYNHAAAFIAPEPGLRPDWLTNRVDVGPIAAPPAGDRTALARAFGRPPERLGVAAFGGFPRAAVPALPERAGLGWLVADADAATLERSDAVALESLGRPVAELIAAADVVVTKPGYGSFAEAAAAGVPALYPARRDGAQWPEFPALDAWAQARGGRCLAPEALDDSQALGAAVDAALAAPRPAATPPTGTAQAAAELARQLGG